MDVFLSKKQVPMYQVVPSEVTDYNSFPIK